MILTAHRDMTFNGETGRSVEIDRDSIEGVYKLFFGWPTRHKNHRSHTERFQSLDDDQQNAFIQWFIDSFPEHCTIRR